MCVCDLQSVGGVWYVCEYVSLCLSDLNIIHLISDIFTWDVPR